MRLRNGLRLLTYRTVSALYGALSRWPDEDLRARLQGHAWLARPRPSRARGIPAIRTGA